MEEGFLTMAEAFGEYIGRPSKAALDIVVPAGARFQEL